ncbi:MAG: hypothetical protein Q4F72_09120 [Desulfovibrionaceae bacterium]|nr:hypothetical protein [Desulfovibrionaceae bacterium]
MSPEEISTLRARLGASQDDMAALLGISTDALALCELGQLAPAGTVATRLFWLADAAYCMEQVIALRAFLNKTESATVAAGLKAFLAALPFVRLPMTGLTLASILRSPIGGLLTEISVARISAAEKDSAAQTGEQADHCSSGLEVNHAG